jgi:predicted nucleotidyltransferase
MQKTTVNRISEEIISVLRRHGANYIALFGSVVKGKATSKSDVDVLVEFSERKSLLDVVGIEIELSEKTGKKVDLLTPKAISPYLIDRIKKELKVIYYEKR